MSWFRNKREATEHKYAQERLSAYLDQELTPGEQGRVERHLAACPQCRCELDNLRRTVQWTMELPVVPCPRAFTIPAPAQAQRVRSAQRVWAMPLLQGATALVAVLFLLAVVGEAFLPARLPVSAPAPAALEREAAPEVEVTQEVEVQAEAVTMMAAEAPAATAAPAEAVAVAEEITAKSAEDQAAAAAASAAPPGMGVGGDIGAQPTQVVEATAPPPSDLVGATGGGPLASETPQPTATSEPTLTPTPEPTATPLPTATLVPTLAQAPTLVAAVEEPAELAQSAQPGERAATERQPRWQWLAMAEIALGAAFVLLGTLTVILLVRRLRRL
jgi:hypothetical protein